MPIPSKVPVNAGSISARMADVMPGDGRPRSLLTASERRLLSSLRTPARIQAFLDHIDYSEDTLYRCPFRVLRERVAHCFDGAVFAAFALRRIGHPPLLVELLPTSRDDDHLIAPYRIAGYWGAIAKSNCTGLRFREPVYRSLRELVMTYFDQYFNLDREKSLRGYRRPLNLRVFDSIEWPMRDEAMDAVSDRLDTLPRTGIVPPSALRRLSLVDQRLFRAGLLDSNPKGLFRPPPRRTA